MRVTLLLAADILLALALAAPCLAQKDDNRLLVTRTANSLPLHSQTKALKAKANSASTTQSVTYGDPPFTMHATSDSPGAITYRLVSGNATVTSTGLVTLTGAGAVTIEAMQVETPNYTNATTTDNFFVLPGTPTITFNVPNVTNASPFAVFASSTSTGAFTYSVISGPAKVAGNMVSLTGTGSVVLKASEAADANYSAASKTVSFAVGAPTLLDFAFAIQGETTELSAPGKAAEYTFSVSPLFGSFAGPVTFSVLGLPDGASAVFTPSTLASDKGPSVVKLYIQPAAQMTRQHKTPDPPSDRGIAVALIVLILPGSRKLRRRLRGGILAVILVGFSFSGAVFLTGCGSGILQPKSGTYNLSVVATSGALQHTQKVTLDMQ